MKPKYDETRNRPDHLDGKGFSDASYRPGYSLKESLQGCTEADLKKGFKNPEY